MHRESLFLAFLPLLAVANPISSPDASLPVIQDRQAKQLNWTTEYSTQCKTCPYSLCPNIAIERENVTLTCWTNGEEIGDTKLWLGTTSNCYVTEYDLVEYPGNYKSDLSYCGEVPFEITRQDADVKYLSECKWSPYTSEESTQYYGRNDDLSLTCWVAGGEVLGNSYWYKTTDDCHVSGTGLYNTPDISLLDNCGPSPDPRANESLALIMKLSPEYVSRPALKNATRPQQPNHSQPNIPQANHSKRWLQDGKIGEDRVQCRSCASANSTCEVETVYKFNQTVISQCVKIEDFVFPNGTFHEILWMLTTDWCYVDSNNFWEPPYDYYRYPLCDNWGL